jgi:hypothetical protein
MFKERDYAEDWRTKGEECPTGLAVLYYGGLGSFFVVLVLACWGAL